VQLLVFAGMGVRTNTRAWNNVKQQFACREWPLLAASS